MNQDHASECSDAQNAFTCGGRYDNDESVTWSRPKPLIAALEREDYAVAERRFRQFQSPSPHFQADIEKRVESVGRFGLAPLLVYCELQRLRMNFDGSSAFDGGKILSRSSLVL